MFSTEMTNKYRCPHWRVRLDKQMALDQSIEPNFNARQGNLPLGASGAN